MLSTFPMALAVFAAGCTDPSYNIAGHTMYKYFPLDGSERGWLYASTDEEVDWQLFVSKTNTYASGDVQVVTLDHSVEDPITALAQVDWSSDSTDGILIHGVHEEDGDVTVTFDPPVIFSDPQAVPGDVATTETGGFTFTSTFVRLEGCGTIWVPRWDEEECVLIEFSDGDEDPSTNGYIVGTYWLVPSYGAALMELDAYPARWSLADADFTE